MAHSAPVAQFASTTSLVAFVIEIQSRLVTITNMSQHTVLLLLGLAEPTRCTASSLLNAQNLDASTPDLQALHRRVGQLCFPLIPLLQEDKGRFKERRATTPLVEPYKPHARIAGSKYHVEVEGHQDPPLLLCGLRYIGVRRSSRELTIRPHIYHWLCQASQGTCHARAYLLIEEKA
jgi:hypothetical protein